MLYALLAAISSVAPTATVIPTPTPSPIPVFVSIIGNTADNPGFWDLLGILSSVILGVVALVISINAYRFAKQQQKREEEMRQREAKIAVIDRAFEVYNYFGKEILTYNYFNTTNLSEAASFMMRENEIRYLVKMIFNDETCNKINSIFSLLEETKIYCISTTFSTPKQIVDAFAELSEKYGLAKYKYTFFLHAPVESLACIMNFISKEIGEIFEEYRLNL